MSRLCNLCKHIFDIVRNKGICVSSEAFPHDTVLFLTGGAGAPLAPLAETPMLVS